MIVIRNDYVKLDEYDLFYVLQEVFDTSSEMI